MPASPTAFSQPRGGPLPPLLNLVPKNGATPGEGAAGEPTPKLTRPYSDWACRVWAGSDENKQKRQIVNSDFDRLEGDNLAPFLPMNGRHKTRTKFLKDKNEPGFLYRSRHHFYSRDGRFWYFRRKRLPYFCLANRPTALAYLTDLGQSARS